MAAVHSVPSRRAKDCSEKGAVQACREELGHRKPNPPDRLQIQSMWWLGWLGWMAELSAMLLGTASMIRDGGRELVH